MPAGRLPHRGRRHPRMAMHMERPPHRRHRDDGTWLLIDVKRENEIWKATSRYRLDGIRTGRQAQAALLLAATGALRPIQERFK